MKKKGRPPGSKNKPTLVKVKRTKLDSLKLSRECLRIVHARAEGSGLSPQTVLEDLIMAGDYTMGQAYDNLSNFRKRIREKSKERNNVVPITSVEATGQTGTNGVFEGNEALDTAEGNEYVPEGQGPVLPGFDDAYDERRHLPEDNPAFRNVGSVGNIISVGASAAAIGYWDHPKSELPDPGPAYVDEEGNPIEPQEVHEGE